MIPAGRKGLADLRANLQCLEAELWSLVALPLLVFNLTSCTGGFSYPKCILCLSFSLPAAFMGSSLGFLTLMGFPLPLTSTSQEAQSP